MHVRSTRNRVLGVDNRRRKSTHGPSKSPRSRRLEAPKEPHRTTRLDGLHQLLPKVHQRILKNRKSPERTHQEERPLGVDGRKRGGLSKTQKAYMRRTGTPHAPIRTTIRTGGGRVELRNRRDPKPKGRTWTVAPGGLLLHNPVGNRKELRHLRQGVAGSSEVSMTLEDIPSRSTPSNSHPHRPLKPPLLERTTKNQQEDRKRITGATRV